MRSASFSYKNSNGTNGFLYKKARKGRFSARKKGTETSAKSLEKTTGIADVRRSNATAMKQVFLFLLFVATGYVARAQNIEKIVVDSTADVAGYYLVVKPPTSDIQGVLVLLDGFGGRAEQIFPETKLHNAAYKNGILTVGLAQGNKVGADSVVVAHMNAVFKDIIGRYKVGPDAFILGGFSAGGTIALRYTQLCKENPEQYPIDPKGVFAVDSPVDLIYLWHFFETQISKNFSPMAVNEAKFVSDIMLKEYGPLQTNLEAYKRLTPFYKDLQEPGNERHLQNIPVRVYHDVDIPWRLKNRRQSAYESNYLNTSEMINRLLLMGNEQAEFITGRTGYRSNGMRHPHSWSIVDEAECIQWVKAILK